MASACAALPQVGKPHSPLSAAQRLLCCSVTPYPSTCWLGRPFLLLCNHGHHTLHPQDMPVDPMEPPKFRHKKVPRGTGSPPVPIMHSPPRAITVKDQQDWKIPPCISNWKNPKARP